MSINIMANGRTPVRAERYYYSFCSLVLPCAVHIFIRLWLTWIKRVARRRAILL